MPTLFDPVQFGAISADNRILMAPLTRARADRDGVPQAFVKDYYAQRSGAGLIISEATGISREGLGWPNAPGIWSEAQVEAWKPVTAAVHAAGSKIVSQLWHMGRLVHPSVSGMESVSSSAIQAPHYAHTYEGKKDYVVPHVLTKDEIAGIVSDYAAAARNAIRAGFDGIQLHAANGYLIDQFLRDNSKDGATTARKIFGAYDQFLALLHDGKKRKLLDGSPDDAGARAVTDEARQIGHDFRDGLEKLFFSTNDRLTNLVRRYGVF